MAEPSQTSLSFKELGLSWECLAAVEEMGFSEPSPVQAAAIPLVLEGRDVVASAQTGTGKTVAFVLPALDNVRKAASQKAASHNAASQSDKQDKKRVQAKQRGARAKSPSVLVITPTRELAQQIGRVANTVCAYTGQTSIVVMGGARFDRQIKALAQGCDLLVATPGRLLDLMDRKALNLSGLQVLVLDEADRMLDMGFWPSVKRIIQKAPKERQTLLFSATISERMAGLIESLLNDPARVEIAALGETAASVEERLCPVVQGQKTKLLEALIAADNPERVLVFCRTKQRVEEVHRSLKQANIKCDLMHSDRRQSMREKALRRFDKANIQVLVATDVMSRGIDVSAIDAVVNYDVPLDPEDYVHRIGRTGRAGATGLAYTFMAPDEIPTLREIEYFTKKLIPTWDLPGFDYDLSRIVPNSSRSAQKTRRVMFSGSRSRGRGPAGGRFGRHS